MGGDNDIDEKKLKQDERDTNRKKAKVKGKVTGAVLKVVFIKVMMFMTKILVVFMIYTMIHDFVGKLLGFIRTDNMPEKTLETFEIDKLEELVRIKGDEESGYYLGYCEEFDEKVKELAKKFKKEHNLLNTSEKTVEKLLRAQLVSQFPNVGGSISQEELEKKLEEQEKNKDNKKDNDKKDKENKEDNSSKGYGLLWWPVSTEYPITSVFGHRDQPLPGASTDHGAVDIGCGEGTSVKATQSGTVTFAAANGNAGNMITIDHGGGYTSTYMHNSEILVSTGDKVSRGQEIAKSGNTGNSTGPHLHFQIEKDGVKLDPEEFKYQNREGNGTKTFGNLTNLNGFLFIGDSITDGLREFSKLTDDITYRGVVSSAPYHWLNDTEVNGNKTFSTLPDNSDSIKGISLMLGTNNVWQIDQMKKLIVKLHEKYPEKTIYVNKILPFPNSEGEEAIAQRKKYVNEIEEYCKTLSYVIYIDPTANVQLENNDVHPTAEGYETLGKNIKEEILNAGGGSADNSGIGIEVDNSYVSKYDGFQGNIKIRRVMPNKQIGEVKDTSSGEVTITDESTISSDGLGTKQDIPEDIKEKMEGVSMQHLTGVTYDDLSYLTIPYYDFEGNKKNGHMVVNKKLADEVLLIFQELFEIKYPIEKMEIIDEFSGNDKKVGADLDYASIDENNTSSFNDRNSIDPGVSNSTNPSLHASGQAIDINPQINPYINSDKTSAHPNAQKYNTNRDTKEGWTDVEKAACITEDSEIYKIFTKYGWKWLGNKDNTGDTQHFYKEDLTNVSKIEEKLTEDGDENNLEKEINKYIEDTATEGKWGVYAKNLASNKVVVDINNKKMESASLIKLFIMATTFDEIKKGNMTLDSVESDLRVMINASDNDATNRLIDKLGFDKINKYIKDNGYSDTEINRKMLDSTNSKDNYTSVEDAGKILEKIYKGTCVTKEASEKMLEYLKEQKRTEKIPAGVPSGVETANKTGELSDVENDAAIVFKENVPYILVVMSSDLNDTKKARDDIKEISSKVYKEIENAGQSEGITTSITEKKSSSINSKIFDLTFVPGSIFEKYVSENSEQALKVFTIDSEGKLITAKWSYDSTSNPPLKITKNSPVNFRTVMQKYTTTYEYLLDFWADIKEEDFINAFIDMVLDSEFIIAIEDNVTTNSKEVTTTIQTYREGTESSTEVTVKENVSDTIELTYADTWFVTMSKETDFSSVTLQGGGGPILTADENGSLGNFRITTYCYACNDDGAGHFGTSVTASGAPATVNHTIAVCPDYFTDPNSPLARGKQVLINGIVYTVEDNGGGCNYFGHNWIDIYVDSCSTANIPDYAEVFIPENIRELDDGKDDEDKEETDKDDKGEDKKEDKDDKEDKEEEKKEDDKKENKKNLHSNRLISSVGNFPGKVTVRETKEVSGPRYFYTSNNRFSAETITTIEKMISCKYDTGTTKVKFKEKEFLKVFEENPEGLESIKPKWLIELVEENAAYMTDITKYLLNKLMEEEIFEGIDLNKILEKFENNDFKTINRSGRISYESLNLTEEDKEILCKITSAERGDGTQEQQEYVVSVILNRVLSSQFPNTVRDVVFAPYQFEPISNGAYDRANPSDTTIAAVENVMENGGTAKTAVYFMTPAASIQPSQNWLNNCIFLFNDEDDSLKDTNTNGTHNFYTTEAIQQELEQYMTSGGGDVVENAIAIHRQVRESGQYSYSAAYGKTVPVEPPHIDCSSYVSWVLLESGFEEFRGAQWNSFTFEENPLKWEEVSLEDAQAGDIVTYYNHVEIMADPNPGADRIIAYSMGSNDSINAVGTTEYPESVNARPKSEITHIFRVPTN